ncbi:FAD/FMN-containing dehydrogenase [Saccharomonospora amisosensis]|uniref:FAD/FMN-containing dehydrogenase n=1 Tax=Saccharomonospora amisosensis TaxID=1128677 RepID=A0A7X5UPH7_9PSEU|nr:FAD-binding oxidoreductase [Saccharomonospora amisosensis]NIJ11838.1 FAD/FMN-containing dehydrogenase [Saccharomonospora amisosensis]
MRLRTRGSQYLPGEPGYDAERKGFQTGFVHRPGLLVRAADAEDIRAAVDYAARHGLGVAVQATGHGVGIPADGDVLVSTKDLGSVHVDPVTRTARIGAGARWGTVLERAAAHGLAPLSGSFPGVGAVGYTLGGGLGPLGRRYGYAADHVRELRLVTPDARLLRVTPDTEPDLFWALRGAGANFGVVTSLEIGLVPQTRIYGGALTFDSVLAADVLNAFREWTSLAPEELTASVAMIPMPDLPSLPPPLRGRHITQLRVAYLGGRAEGERLVAPLRELGQPIADTLRELPFAESGSIYGEPDQPRAYFGDNVLLRELDPAAVDALLEHAGPGSDCVVDVRHLGGALARPTQPSAVSHRAATYQVLVLSGVDTWVESPESRAVQDKVFAALAPATLGRSVNFAYGPVASARERFDAVTYERLRKLKALHDPRNLFRFHSNIEPG